MESMESMESMEILPGIHRIAQPLGKRWLYQYVLAGERPLLLDTGLASSPDAVIAPALAAAGLQPTDLDTVLITHADVDHCGGNAAMRRLGPRAALVAHAADQPLIESRRQMLVARYGWYDAHDLAYPPETLAWMGDNLGPDTPLDRTVDDGVWLDLGGRRVQVLHLPGHSAGHVGLWDPDTRTALVGNAVLGRGLPDRAGRIISPPPYFSVGSYLATIARLERLAPDTLLTAHYPVMRGADVARFLLASQLFVEEAGQAVADLLRAAPTAIALKELTASADARVGPYAILGNELAGPVLAHVADLAAAGWASPVAADGPPAWRWVETTARPAAGEEGGRGHG